jgi:hypothetical protein
MKYKIIVTYHLADGALKKRDLERGRHSFVRTQKGWIYTYINKSRCANISCYCQLASAVIQWLKTLVVHGRPPIYSSYYLCLLSKAVYRIRINVFFMNLDPNWILKRMRIEEENFMKTYAAPDPWMAADSSFLYKTLAYLSFLYKNTSRFFILV